MDNALFWEQLEMEAVDNDEDYRCVCGKLLRSTQNPLCDLCYADFELSDT